MNPWRKPLSIPHPPLQITLWQDSEKLDLLGTNGDLKGCSMYPELSRSGSGKAVWFKIIVQCSHLQLSSSWPDQSTTAD